MSVLNDDYCEELAYPHLSPNGKFGYKVWFAKVDTKKCNGRHA